MKRRLPRLRRVITRALWASLVGFTLLLLCVGFGTTGADRARLRAFADAVDRWQVNPDFRRVAHEYAALGHQAMSVRCCGVTASRIVMVLRSQPGVPEAYSVNPTSGAHYEAFARGPLAAYLHLCSEQGTADGVRMVEDMGRGGSVGDDHIRAFLGSFKLLRPTPTDDGAVAGLRRLLTDVNPSRPFAVRDSVHERLAPHVASIASQLGAPTEPRDMTPAQQRTVWDALDARVRTADPELWRTKQVNDLLGGIWAQGYGGVYRALIEWALRAQLVARALSVLCVCLIVVSAARRRALPR